LLSRFTDL
jgi:hypothetical protein